MKPLSREEMEIMIRDVFDKEGYAIPINEFEHRVDSESLGIIYSFIRQQKPVSCLQIGTWEGGTTCVIQAALNKNNNNALFVASELLPDKLEHTREHCIRHAEKAPVMIGDITKNLDKVPAEIDFLFHDTDHDKETTEWVLANIFPRLKKGALVIFHDWAVEEDTNGNWFGKGDHGSGGWPETQVLIDLHNSGNLPLKKVFWNYHNTGNWETGVFELV